MPYGNARSWKDRLSEQSGWAYLSIMMILTGPLMMVDPSRLAPSTIYGGLPITMVYGWAAALFVGGTGIFLGILTGHAAIERIGHAWVAIALCVWITCICTINFMPNRIPGLMTYGVALMAFVARYRWLGKRQVVIHIPDRLRPK